MVELQSQGFTTADIKKKNTASGLKSAINLINDLFTVLFITKVTLLKYILIYTKNSNYYVCQQIQQNFQLVVL